MNETNIPDNLTALETLLQVTFSDRTLLRRAITHHSCCPDTAVHDSYDTLEFLGDAIISAHVVEYIYRTHPDAAEGEMTALKSEVVSRRILAQVGQQLGLFPFIHVDIANLRTFNERSRDSLCADVLEAIVGAIHIDQGTEIARNFVMRTVFPMIELVSTHTLDSNPKGRLQKVILQRTGNLPRYRVLEQSGRHNDRVFLVGVFDHDQLLGTGKASSIKEAGRLAAREALQLLQKKDKRLSANDTTA
ncbi:ribonuclease III [Dictyobacter arantiisoli]|uniref:Ribonuclease 3 n=1 Tax=Dictyobacter arantiisoli TaxID=2014874 RepID=A0A5A5T6F0_9CHLR|nr:ribonuclease III [Dictyobacter arantiisoli]GCF06593.1 ribonuclease 3 [Dictyobacter arantiisoli]